MLPSAYASPLNLQELDGQAEHTPQVAMPKPVPCKNYPKNVQELEEKFQVEYIAGGATQNSARVAQWMLQVCFVTAVGRCVVPRLWVPGSCISWCSPDLGGCSTGDAAAGRLASVLPASVNLRCSHA